MRVSLSIISVHRQQQQGTQQRVQVLVVMVPGCTLCMFIRRFILLCLSLLLYQLQHAASVRQHNWQCLGGVGNRLQHKAEVMLLCIAAQDLGQHVRMLPVLAMTY